MYSTLRLKDSVDEVATFLDGGKLPCILIENKVDLLDKEDIDNTKELEEFTKNNGFVGCFRTSAKTGKNINEAMSYLIENIIMRFNAMQTKEGDVFKTERKSITLDPDKRNETSVKRREQKKEESEESIDDTKKKCSNKEHKNKEAINFCYKCQLYLCDECTDYHKGLL